uniref:Uncharacterized protein n=1 Tax=Lotus japonicus TaxID=34305 RepID=I3SSE6_LOTJA|nr:unknown [Lotus japonicus]
MFSYTRICIILQPLLHFTPFPIKYRILHLILITGLSVAVEAGRVGRTTGTRLTTENASLRRATRTMS